MKIFVLLLLSLNSHSTSMLYPCYKFGFAEEIVLSKETPKEIIAKKENNDGYPPVEHHYLFNKGREPLIVKANHKFYKLVEGKIFEGKMLQIPEKEIWTDDGVVIWEEMKVAYAYTKVYFKNFYKNVTIPDLNLLGSNEKKLDKPDDLSFSISAYYSGKRMILKGSVKYMPVERKCKY